MTNGWIHLCFSFACLIILLAKKRKRVFFSVFFFVPENERKTINSISVFINFKL